jgi:hypothetical protein
MSKEPAEENPVVQHARAGSFGGVAWIYTQAPRVPANFGN